MGDLPYESIGGRNLAKVQKKKAVSGDGKPIRPSTPALPSNAEQEVESLHKVCLSPKTAAGG